MAGVLAGAAPLGGPGGASAAAAGPDGASAAAFLTSVTENPNFNQYWYSAATIAALAAEIDVLRPATRVGSRAPPEAPAGGARAHARVAFLCTPSLFFAFPAATRAARGYVLLDIDTAAFGSEAGFERLDFLSAAPLPPHLAGAFDAVVIDPPFITADVWAAAARCARALLGADGEAGDLAGGQIIATTVRENAALLAQLLAARRVAFRPSIPHLVYQYDAFVSGFEPQVLCARNAEVPDEDEP